MKMDELVKTRFSELEEKANEGIILMNRDGEKYVNYEKFHEWSTSALSLIRHTFGDISSQYQNFFEKYKEFKGYTSQFETCKGVFNAAKEDYEGGYIFGIERTISGEILSDFIFLAKAALQESNKDVAAVLASAALEDALKRYASENNLEVKDKVMQEVISALKSKGLVSGAQKSMLETMPKLRDYAMHANWDKISQEDVGSMIGFVEQFLLKNFS